MAVQKSELQLIVKTMLSICFSQLREFQKIRKLAEESQAEEWAFSPLGKAALEVVQSLDSVDHLGALTRVAHKTQQLVNDVDESACSPEDIRRFLEQIVEIKNEAQKCHNAVEQCAKPFKAAAHHFGLGDIESNSELN